MEEKGWPERTRQTADPSNQAKCPAPSLEKFGAGATAVTEGRHRQAQTRTEALAAPLNWRQAVPRSQVHARHEPLAQLTVLKTVARNSAHLKATLIGVRSIAEFQLDLNTGCWVLQCQPAL